MCVNALLNISDINIKYSGDGVYHGTPHCIADWGLLIQMWTLGHKYNTRTGLTSHTGWTSLIDRCTVTSRVESGTRVRHCRVQCVTIVVIYNIVVRGCTGTYYTVLWSPTTGTRDTSRGWNSGLQVINIFTMNGVSFLVPIMIKILFSMLRASL